MNEMFEKICELSKEDRKTLIQKALKLSEETGEVAQAVLSYENVHGCGYKGLGREDIIEECSDVVIVAVSILGMINCSQEEFEATLTKKLNKWKNKIGACDEDNYCR